MLKRASSKVLLDESPASYVRPAVVVESDAPSRRLVRLAHGGRDVVVPAVMAMAHAPPLEIGASVLVTGESLDTCYILGVLGEEPAPVSGRQLTTRAGATAAVTTDGDHERIEVRDPAGKMLFEYRPDLGKGTLSMPTGDLALSAPQGNIDIVAGGAVRCRAGDGVTLEAGDERGEQASLSLGRGAARLGARALHVSSERAEVLFGEARVHGVKLAATVSQAKLVVERMETLAVHMIQRVKRSFRSVEDLDDLKAGRVRTVVEGAYSVKGGHASIQAEDDVKIDGKRIYFG